ncbi:MAG: hydrogenase iron-sulfur subunit [Nitrospirae bacterium YQR-1]
MKEQIKPTTPLKVFHRITNVFSSLFSFKLNPLHFLGAIAIYLLVADTISGIYLYIFYNIDPRFCFSSVEKISASFMGNLMRGVHRYTSAALIFTTLVHTVHVLVTDRFRMFRWVAWITGVLALMVFIVIGISGYILVWDAKAQLIGVLTGKFLSYLPIFGDSIMSTFFGNDIKLLGGLFRMLLYFHVALTIGIVFVLWIHVMRNARPRLVPPKFLWIALTVNILVISFLLRAKSDAGASLASIPFEIHMDWAYFFVYPLLNIMPISTMWLVVSGTVVLLVVFPWIIKGRKVSPAVIDRERCTGCERCYIDCPYEAVTMRRIEGGKKKAVVDESKCSACGVCVGACSFKSITLEDYPWVEVLDEIKARLPKIVAFRCKFTAEIPSRSDVMAYDLPCIGSVHVNHAKEILDAGVKGIFMVGCEQDDCHYREGCKWTVQRYEKTRKPSLHKDVDVTAVRVFETTSVENITKELDKFIADLDTGFKTDKLMILGHNKINYILASIVLIVAVAILYPLTNDLKAFYPEDKAVIILTFKYRSTSSVASARSPIKVELLENGKPIYSREYYPRGIRRDSSVFVYDEILVAPTQAALSFRMVETLFPEKKSELNIDKNLKPKDSVIISYDEHDKNFLYLKDNQ